MRSLFPTLFLLLGSFSSLLVADTVILKDGTKIKGEILEEGTNSITIEYFATATIKDQKIVSKDEIEQIEKISPDQKAFEELGPLEAPLTVLDASFYDPLINRKLPNFIKKYPYSRHLPTVREKLKTLTEERDRVTSGARRLEGVWITSAEIAADPYQTGAATKYAVMKGVVASGNPVEALRTYELLEKTYPGSSVLPDAVDAAFKPLDQLQAQISVARANGEIAMKNMSNAIAAAPADQAKLFKDQAEREVSSIKAAIKTATADGSKFFPVFQNDKEALDALQALVTAERARLTQLQKSSMRDGIAVAKQGLNLIKGGKLKEAQEQLALSLKLWPANIDNTKLKEQADQLAKDQASQPAGKK
jgi:hypothetical protein